MAEREPKPERDEELRSIGRGWVRESHATSDDIIVVDVSEFDRESAERLEEVYRAGKAEGERRAAWRDPWQWAAWLALTVLAAACAYFVGRGR